MARQWPEGFSRAEQASIVSDHKDMAIELGRQVGIWSNSPGDAVQVYDNGYWEADEALFQAVQKVSAHRSRHAMLGNESET